MKPSTRLPYIDVMKIVATFAIVMLHTSALYVQMDAALLHPSGALLYIINALTRTALPLFMMVSGALLLRDGYQFDLKKRFFFILKTYVLWSALYVCCDQLMRLAAGGGLLAPEEIIGSWIRGPYHFWYLQMLLGFYILMPLLARIKGLQTLNYAAFLFFIILYLYNPLAPFLPEAVRTFAAQLIQLTPSPMIFFFLIGACLHRVPLRRNLAVLAIGAIACGLSLRLVLLFRTETYAASMLPQPFNSYSELLLAVGIFYLTRYLCHDLTSAPRLVMLSNCTLRIYISSALVIYVYQYLIQPHWDALVPWPTLSVLFWSTVVFLICWLIAHLLSIKDRALHARRERRSSR